MDKRTNRDQIQNALNTTLSGLRDDPWLAQRVLNAANAECNGKGGIVVKRKMPLAVILIIIMMLGTVAYAAVSLYEYYEKVMEKEGEVGYVEDWKFEDKLLLVEWMVEAGVNIEQDILEILSEDTLSIADKHALIDDIIDGYYPSRDGILTTLDIIAKDKGAIGTWSLEDKAWYSDMQLRYNNGVTNTRNILPGQESISETEAVQAAINYYISEHGLTSEYLQSARMENYYQECVVDDAGTIGKRWRLNFVFEDDKWPLSIEMTPDGTVTWASAPHVESLHDEWYNTMMQDDFWTIEGLYRFRQNWARRVEELITLGEVSPDSDLAYLVSKPYILPTSTMISKEEAHMIADSTIAAEYNTPNPVLDNFTVSAAALRADNPDKPVFWFVYQLSRDRENQLEAENLHFDKRVIPYMV